MTKKENRNNFWLEEFESFYIEGDSAKRFLNGITTTNINLDVPFMQACWLNPKGIMRALLEIHVYKGKLLLVNIEGNFREIKDFFGDMIFPSDKVFLSDNFHIFRLQEVKKDQPWRKFAPKIFITEDPKKYCLENQIEILKLSNLEEWKIWQAIPRLNYEIDGKNNPLELGLCDLIDFNKGCYLGQETMARLKRTSSLRQEIRVWSAYNYNKNFELNDKKIYLNNNKKVITGTITSLLTLDSKKVIGLAMMKNNYLNQLENFFNEELGSIKVEKSIGSAFF
tara:strand:+ start:297 stop:1139 length:843 start_codon:yes stop_codon:yes gene_type:complete